MVLAIIVLPLNVGTLAAIFVLGGMYIAIEETLEDSLCAELVSNSHHGMAFGTLAAVNGVGDFASSFIVGAVVPPSAHPWHLLSAQCCSSGVV